MENDSYTNVEKYKQIMRDAVASGAFPDYRIGDSGLVIKVDLERKTKDFKLFRIL